MEGQHPVWQIFQSLQGATSTHQLYSQIASIGALLIIGGLAIDPLSQQLVHYRAQIVLGPLGSATLPAASNWTGSTQDSSAFGKSLRETDTHRGTVEIERLMCIYCFSWPVKP